jgi:hypothetical protein
MKYHAPLDPLCIKANKFKHMVDDDPMTKAMGAPVDEIMEDFEKKHRKTCKQCQEYGLANIEVVEGY